MPNAKENFINRISSFEKIVSPSNPLDSVLISRALTEVEHNEKVKMLRNGMAIIAFTILEDFVKKKIGEILKNIGSTTVSFSALPSKIREAATVNALKGIQNRADTLKRNAEDHISFIQNEAWYVSSTKDAVFEFSEFSLGWDKSNVSADDIKLFLGIFGVKDGWGKIQQVSSAISITLVNPGDTFKNAAQRRHKAAHNVAADSLLIDLQDFVTQAKVIALGFDSLLTRSLKFIANNDVDFLNETKNIELNHLKFRFILEKDGRWKEYSSTSTRAVKTESSLSNLQAQALTRARNNNEILVIKSASNQLIDWYIH
jgi:hypothetical protein